MIKRYAANKVLLDNEFVRNTIIDIDEDGVVTSILRDFHELDSQRCVEFFNGIIIAVERGSCSADLEAIIAKGIINADMTDVVIEVGECLSLVLIDDINFASMTFGSESRATCLI